MFGGGQLTGQIGGNRTVALDPTGFVASGEQGPVGDDQVDHHPHPGLTGSGGPGEDAVDEEVGHQLAVAAGITVGDGFLGALVQGGDDRDPVLDRQQGSELGHHLGCGAQGDPAVCFGADAALDEGGGVEAVGDLSGFGLELPDPHRFEPVGVTGQLGVHGQPVLESEARGFPGDHGGCPFGDPAGTERRHRVRQLLAQDHREAEVALPAVR